MARRWAPSSCSDRMSQRTAGRQGRRERRRAARRTGSAPPQGPPPAVGLQTFLPLLVLVSAGLLAFHNSLQGPFVFDDLQSIPANPSIRGLWTALSPTPYRSVQGRPTANLSLAVNYALSGLQVWDYHAFNMAIHIAASIAMFGVVRRTLLRPSLRDRYGADAPWLAMAVALIWAVHPLQAESVTYIVQRTELLMGLFLLGTLYCLIRGLESSHRRAWYAAAVVCCALGMGSKEVMVSAPLIVVLYDRVFLSSSFREMFRQRWGLYVGLAGTWLILAALVATTPHRRTGFAFADLTPLDYARTQAGVIVHYLKLAFWPHPLVADHDDWPVVRTTRAALPAGAVVATLLGGISTRFGDGRHWASLGHGFS